MSKGLMTSGVRWGISCEVDDEATMGVVLGYLTLLGAKNIAWAPVGKATGKQAKGGKAKVSSPSRVEGAKKAAATRRKNNGDKRKPSSAVGAEFLAAHPADFQVSDLAAALKKAGYMSATAAYPLVNAWIKAGSVKRTGTGTYSNLTRKASPAAKAS